MGSGRATRGLGQFWQFPLLAVSVCAFGIAGYLLIGGGSAPTVGQRIEAVRACLKQERGEAAVESLNKILELSKVKGPLEGAVRVLLGEALEMAQRQRRLDLPANHQRIIEQTKKGMGLGIEADAQMHRRLAESYEALGRRGQAIAHYEKAAALDPSRGLKWERRVIELQLREGRQEEAAGLIERHLSRKDLIAWERMWAMGQKAGMLVDRGEYQEAEKLLGEALKLESGEPGERGAMTYWMGYCRWKLGEVHEAERLLRVSRDLLRVQHPLDAEAAYALGRIREDQRDFAGANSFYASVLQSHLDSPAAPRAKLRRGICRIALEDDDAGLSDLAEVTRLVQAKASLPAGLRGEVAAGLREGAWLLTGHGNQVGALEVLTLEREVSGKVGADFFERLGGVYERRAEQLRKQAEGLGVEERSHREGEGRDSRTKAGDAYVAAAQEMTVLDDKGHGAALWKAIDLYERAGNVPQTIVALERFAKERPEDARTPQALLKLGQAYQAAGAYDAAIEAFRRNEFRYGKSLAASKSLVPLARAYIAKGPESYGRAEEVLRGVVESNAQITPEAEEFRESLWELANLYCRTGRFEPAIGRLEEMRQRYPEDVRKGQMLFLMGDSYRKSVAVLDDRAAAAKGAATKPALDLAEAKREREDRLKRARELYGRVIEHYRGNESKGEMDRLYLKLSHFYQADCVYDLGQFEEAIKLYGDAAFRYQDDALALGAYVQIINANVALGRKEEAKAANERAKWMLRRMPEEAFADRGAGMSRPYWEQWLRWAGESGMWK